MVNSRRLKRAHFFKISLQWVIVVPFVVQVISAVGLVGYLSYQSGHQAVEKIISQLLRQTSERVSDRLNNYLHTPQQIVATNNSLVKQKILSLDDIERVKKQLWQQLQLNPSLDSNGFWGDKTMAITYMRLSSEGFQKLVKQKSGKSIPLGTVLLSEANLTRRRFYTIDNQGNTDQLLFELEDDFQLAPWYLDAQKIETQSWTPISLCTVLPLLQVVAVYPIYDQQKQLKGFFNAQYFLANISRFLNQLKFTSTGQIFIIDRSGYLVATSVSADESGLKQVHGKFLRLNATDSQDRITREVSSQLKQQFGNFDNLQRSQQVSLTVENLKKFVQIDHYQDTHGLDWYVVMVIPEADFIGEIQNNVYRTLILCILALLGSVSIGILTSRRIVRSLSHLTNAAKSFTEDHLEPDFPDTHIIEAKVLSEAMQQMIHELKESDHLRLSYAKELEQQVAEKTNALIKSQRIARMGSWEFDIATGTNIWSEAQYQILGFDPTVPLPKSDDSFTLLPEEDRLKMRTVVETAIAKGTPYMVEHGIIRPDGSICYVISRGEPVFNQQGQLIKLVGTIVDVSDRKRLEQELIQSRDLRELIFNESSDALFLVNSETLRTVDCNQRAVDLFEVDHKSELLDIEGHILQKRQFTPQELEYISQEISQKGFWSLEVEYITRKGREFWGDISAKQIVFGTQKFNLVRVVDISDRKQIAINLAKAKLAAEEATKSKSAFLASMSHEIRTPMNGIIGMTQLLQTTALSEEQQDFVKTIKDSGESLLTIINDILDFSKIESQKLDLESKAFQLEELIIGVCKILERQAQEKGITLRYGIDSDTPLIVIGDRFRLRQVLLNLLGNALKFTSAGQVLLSVKSLQIEKDSLTRDGQCQLKFEIVDTGIGIARDRIGQLFQPFTQADASISRKYGGTGLGLAISKRLVELMGGTIWVESFGQVSGEPVQGWQPLRQTEGATFHFTITVGHDQAIACNQIDVDCGSDELLVNQAIAQKFPLQILLVEDNKVNQMIANKFLKKIGYKIDIVNNGLECLEAIQTKSYDLIFMDLQMPEMDGLTATKLIRERLSIGGDRIQIVAMTANAMAEDRQICLDTGMDDYVSKPISIQQIIDIVRTAYRQSHQSRSS